MGDRAALPARSRSGVPKRWCIAIIPIRNFENCGAGRSPSSASPSQSGMAPPSLISRTRAGPVAITSSGFRPTGQPTAPMVCGRQKVRCSSRVIRTRPVSAVMHARRYQVVSRGAIVGIRISFSMVASADSGSSVTSSGSGPALGSTSRRSSSGEAERRTLERAVPAFCLSSTKAIPDSTGCSSSEAAIAYSRTRSRRASGPWQERK